MNEHEHGAVILTEDETAALAMLIAIRKLEEVDYWLEWGDLPNLGEYGCDEVIEAIQQATEPLRAALAIHERQAEVDSREIYGEVS